MKIWEKIVQGFKRDVNGLGENDARNGGQEFG